MIEAEIRELTPQPTAAVRVTQPMSELDLAALFDEHLPEQSRIGWPTSALEPAGPPYGRYHQFGPDIVDVEIGIPARCPARRPGAADEAEPGELIAGASCPAAGSAITVHRGSYDELSGRPTTRSTTGSTRRDATRGRGRGSRMSTIPARWRRTRCGPRSAGRLALTPQAASSSALARLREPFAVDAERGRGRGRAFPAPPSAAAATTWAPAKPRFSAAGHLAGASEQVAGRRTRRVQQRSTGVAEWLRDGQRPRRARAARRP